MFFRKKKNITEDIINLVMKRDRLKRYTFLVIGCFLIAFSFNIFFASHNLITGGISGIAITLKNTLGVETYIFIPIAYVVLLTLSFIVLGKEKTKYSIIGSMLFPFFIYITRDIASIIHFDVDNLLLITLYGAILEGLGAGLTFKYGFSTGGGDVIAQIISKYFKVSIGTAMKIMNFTVLIGSGFFLSDKFYAWENVMYSGIAIYIITFLTDKVLLGISNSKSFYIITEHETAIKKFLIEDLKRGVTVLEGRGGYTGDRKKVLLCAIPTKDYFFAKEVILELDSNAIILINDLYESTGIE